MRNYLCHKFIAVTILASVFIPQQAFSNPLFDEGSWRTHSFYTRTTSPGLLLGIGGLQAEIKKARELDLEPSDISYNGGYLRVDIEDQQIKIKVSPNIVREAIRVVEHNDNFVFQVSIDYTLVGRNKYIDNALKGTNIGKFLLEGDLGFASIVHNGLPLPNPQTIHPYTRALQLLINDAEYRTLPTEWESPPLSWPQIYLYFEPAVSGLIRTEFKPQVFFNSPYGHSLEVDEKVQALGERPYLPLIKDVKEYPLAYRGISPSLDRAASITATLGLLEAACQKPRSCKDLKSQTKRNGKDYKDKIDKEKVAPDPSTALNRFRLNQTWEKLSHPVFQPGETPKAWAAAYDALQRAIRKEYAAYNFVQEGIKKKSLVKKLKEQKKVGELKQDIKRLEREAEFLIRQAAPLKNLAKQQFLHYPIPNDSLLLAASAVFFAWDGNETIAEQKLNTAIQLSSDYAGDRFNVLKMGLYMASIINRTDSGKELAYSIVNRVKPLLNQAKNAAYDEVENYLKSCLENLAKCPEEELRKWEANAVRTELTGKMSTRDLAWLHGQFSYLIGIQLEQPEKQRDRLRFLSFYTQNAWEDNRLQLCSLEIEFKKSLGVISDACDSLGKKNWIIILILMLSSKSSFFLVHIKMQKTQMNQMRKILK
jgi:hypothetical protein